MSAGCVAATWYGSWTGMTSLPPCPGCNDAYKTMCSGAPPHNQEVCVAYKRGYEAGKMAQRLETVCEELSDHLGDIPDKNAVVAAIINGMNSRQVPVPQDIPLESLAG